MTRVATGRTFQANVMGNTASNGTGNYAPAVYMAFSPTVQATNDGDTSLVGEITSGTLARGICVFAYTAGASSYTLSRTVTSDQAVQLNRYGIFNVATPGSGSPVFLGSMPSPPVVVSGDMVANTETVSL